MVKHQTNVQFIKQFMEQGSSLRQVFVLDSIENVAKRVADTELRPVDWPDMISWPAWKECAIDYLAAVHNRSLS